MICHHVKQHQGMSVLSIRTHYLIAGLALLALTACGDTSPKWEAEDMFASPAEQPVDEQYRVMADFKALSRDEAGVEYAAGPSATVLGAVEEAVALCQDNGGQNCKAVRVGLAWVDGLDQTEIEDVINTYRDTLTAEAYQAAQAGNIEAANWIAFHYATRGENLGEAERQIKRAMQAQPDNPAILDTYGLILYKQGKYQEAEEVFIAVNKVVPTAEHLAHFADNALAMGKTDMARAAYQRALAAQPSAALSQEIQKRLLALDLGGDAAPQ